MKLNANDKVEIYYHLKQLGWTWPQLSQRFNVTKVHLQYLVRLIDKHGLDCAQKGKNNYYSPELKEESPTKRPFSTRRFTGLRTAK